MTPAQVVMSAGIPDRRQRVTEEKGVTEEWQYERWHEKEKRVAVYRHLYFSGQKLIRIREID